MNRFHRLLSKGISAKESLEILVRFEEPLLTPIIHEIQARLQGGSRLSVSLEPLALPSALQQLLKVGDQTERPLMILKQVIRLLELESQMKKKFWKMARYPLVLAASLLLLFMFYSLYVFPSLLEMSNPDTLPRFVLPLIHPSAKYILAFSPFVSVILLIVTFRRIPLNRLLQMKMIQKILRLYYSYLFTIEVGSFIDAGFSLEEAFRSLEQGQTGKKKQMYGLLHQRQKSGQPLSEAMQDEDIIDVETVGLVHIARESGDLGRLLLEQASLLHESIEEEIEKKLLLIEPALYGELTVMTGTLFLILYYPIQLAIQQLPF
ncbi:type II secretion system F family protein [Exiguobacterium antarcticum]|uniref:type II secretion system F family protein n=1 Tax=Exiguobacterium antarcticum TaxID=132920 RepID=UPI0009E07D66|nr:MULTISPECIES: type II secretion system F family protein [Exiguobacterium]